jgi:hypothetical protein
VHALARWFCHAQPQTTAGQYGDQDALWAQPAADWPIGALDADDAPQNLVRLDDAVGLWQTVALHDEPVPSPADNAMDNDAVGVAAEGDNRADSGRLSARGRESDDVAVSDEGSHAAATRTEAKWKSLLHDGAQQLGQRGARE